MHVGIILDGNRRYARKKNLPSLEGHLAGAKKVKQLIDRWAPELDIKELTLYTLSIQNLKRSKEELKYLMNILLKSLKKVIKYADKIKAKLNAVGNLNLLPKTIKELILKAIKLTENNKGLKINFAIGYGGREEIVEAVKKIIDKKIPSKQIDTDTITENLYLKNEPDLIIRTGGDCRTSNFLVWQSWYSEWFFIKKLWPEFTKNDLKKILTQFNQRERRFGK